MLVTSTVSRRVDVAFDVYREVSIKNVERLTISRLFVVTLNSLLHNFIVQAGSIFLYCTPSEEDILFKRLVLKCKIEAFRGRLGNRITYVMTADQCWRLASLARCEPVPEHEWKSRRG